MLGKGRRVKGSLIRNSARISRLALLIAAMACLGAAAAPVSARQDAPPAPIEIGAGPVRERAFALVGRTVYSEDSVQVYGYLTAVIGLDPALLFTDASTAPQTARFTYAGEMPIASRQNRGDVTQFAGEGTITIFHDEAAGAVWDDPGSFADGAPVAELAVQLHDTVQRQAPAVGVVVGDATFRQESTGELVIAGETYRFGQDGIEGRLRTVGALIESADAPGMVVGLTGSGSVSAREAIPVIPGATGA
jgi:hypothetical protein